MGGSGAGTLLGLTLATVLILVLAWAASRWIGLHGASLPGGGGGFAPGGGGGERFHVLALLPLGRNERLALVRFQDRCLLLGVTEHGITLLRELDGDEAAAWFREDSAPPGFAEILGHALNRKKRE